MLVDSVIPRNLTNISPLPVNTDKKLLSAAENDQNHDVEINNNNNSNNDDNKCDRVRSLLRLRPHPRYPVLSDKVDVRQVAGFFNIDMDTASVHIICI